MLFIKIIYYIFKFLITITQPEIELLCVVKKNFFSPISPTFPFPLFFLLVAKGRGELQKKCAEFGLFDFGG